MTKQVELFEIHFENTEAIILHRQYIGKLELSGISRNIIRNHLTDISEHVSVDEVVMQISSEANVEESYIGDNHNLSPFERITVSDDICEIIVHYEDETKESFMVKHDDLFTKQTSFVNESTGDLFLVIGKNKTIHTEFATEIKDKRKPKIWKEIKEF